MLTEGLSNLGVYSALLAQGPLGTSEDILRTLRQGILVPRDVVAPEELDLIRQEIEENLSSLRSYRAVATGIGKDTKGSYLGIALVHDDSDTAAENVDKLNSRIEDVDRLISEKTWGSSVEGIEINSEGQVVLAKIRGPIALKCIWWCLGSHSALLGA